MYMVHPPRIVILEASSASLKNEGGEKKRRDLVGVGLCEPVEARYGDARS